MKIGIITRHDVYNYGAILQAYALETYIASLGHDVEIIDYQHKSRRDIRKNILIPKIPHKFDLKKFKSFISECKMTGASILYLRERRFRKKCFENFSEKYIIKSKKTYLSETELISECETYDAYITGSDQVWRVNPTDNSVERPFFLCFAERDKPRIAYAVSMGREGYPKEYESEISELLTNLDSISLREKGSIEYINRLTNKKIHHALDPVFLIGKSQWDNLMIAPNMINNYILIYSVSYDKRMYELIEMISKETKWDVVCIGHDYSRKNYRPIYRKPEEFIGLIANAAYVITNSFHGTAFSIIFERRFTSITPKNESFRIHELLKTLSLTNRIFGEEDIPPHIQDHIHNNIDYININKTLERHVENSKTYLLNSLKSN